MFEKVHYGMFAASLLLMVGCGGRLSRIGGDEEVHARRTDRGHVKGRFFRERVHFAPAQ